MMSKRLLALKYRGPIGMNSHPSKVEYTSHYLRGVLVVNKEVYYLYWEDNCIRTAKYQQTEIIPSAYGPWVDRNSFASFL